MDNLKLGYGGTKEEMERLLEDAEKISGIEYDISSYADIVDAIHVVQTEMGIAGTTAKEASETISGSMAAAKSAWQNLLTGIADDNADFDKLVNNFVDSVGTAASNIIPRIEVALTGAGKLVESLVPVIVEKIPSLVQNVLPSLLQSGLSIVTGVVQGIVDSLPTIFTTGIDVILMLIDGLIEAIPQLVDALPEVVIAIANAIIDNAPRIFQAGVKLIGELINSLVRNIPKLLDAAVQMVKAIITTFASYYGAVADVGKNIVRGLWDGIKSMASWIGDKVSGFFEGIVDGAKDLLGIHSPSRVFAGIGKFMAEGLGEGWDDEFSHIRKDIESGLNFETSVTATGGGAVAGGVNIVVNINGNATAEMGNEIGRRIVNEMRYRGVLAHA